MFSSVRREEETSKRATLFNCGLVTLYGDTDLGQILDQVIARSLTAPSHYLNQY